MSKETPWTTRVKRQMRKLPNRRMSRGRVEKDQKAGNSKPDLEKSHDTNTE
jgi:hypothetical protein